MNDTSSDPKQDNIIIYKKKIYKLTKVGFVIFRYIFFILYGIPEVREASRNLPGADDFAPIEYEHMATHGDPIQPQNYQSVSYTHLTLPTKA